MHLRTFFFPSLLVLSCALPACDADRDDDVAQDELEHRTKPKGTDNDKATVTVKRPPLVAGTTLADSTFWKQVPSDVAREEHELEDELGGLTVGTHSIRVVSHEVGASFTADVRVEVSAGSSTVLETSGLAPTISAARMPWGLKTILPGRVAPEDDRVEDAELRFGTLPSGTKTHAVFPGDYYVVYGAFDGVFATVGAGEAVSFDLSDPAQRRLARIVHAAAELPNACANANRMTIHWVDASQGSRRQNKSVVSVYRDQPFELGQNPKLVELLARGVDPEVRLSLPCVDLPPVPVAFADIGQPAAELRLGRIDVDDVQITAPNGTTTTVAGQYHVIDVATGRDVVPWTKTNTGYDLLPGTYKVEIEYPQSAGTVGTYEETFTTP